MLLQPVIENSYLVELNMATVSVGQRYTFNDVPQLRAGSILVKGVEAYSADQLSTSPNARPVIASNAMPNIVVTLVEKDTEVIYQIPYFTLVSSLNGGLIRMLKNKQINLVKSYAICYNTTGITAGDSLMFNFYYSDGKSPKY